MNFFQDKVLVDTNRKAVIKFTAFFDGSGQETSNTKIQGKNLKYALATDSNNAVLVSAGGNTRTNYNYSISRIIYDVNVGGYLKIVWDGTTPGNAAIIHGVGDTNPTQQQGEITNNALSPNGNVTFTTVGAAANNSYTVIMELRKGPNSANQACDYSMGQTESSIDFNFGRYSIKP